MKNISGMPVQKQACRTCPFAGADPLPLSPESLRIYCSDVVNLQGSHLCHTVDSEMICRGGRDIQLRILTLMGALAAPTDEEFERVSRFRLGEAYQPPSVIDDQNNCLELEE